MSGERARRIINEKCIICPFRDFSLENDKRHVRCESESIRSVTRPDMIGKRKRGSSRGLMNDVDVA